MAKRAGSPIWMIINSYQPLLGGAERNAKGLSEHLAKLGWSVHVLTRRHIRRYCYSGVGDETISGVKVHRVFSRGPRLVGAGFFFLCGFWTLYRHRQHGTFYYAHDVGAPAWLAIVASHLLGGRSIVKIRSGSADSLRYYRRSLFLNRLSWLADRFVVVSRETEALLVQCGIARDRIVLVPNGTDGARFSPASPGERLAARRHLGLPVDRIVALCAGRLVPVKGYDVLIEAIAGLPREAARQMEFVIVGDGPEAGHLKDLAVRRGVESHVRFEGHREETADYFKAADLFILPSRGEGLSNALVEAMASGLPAICSAVGGALDWIQQGVNGALVQPGDASGLTTAIAEMVARREKWQAMGEFSVRLVDQELTFAATSKRLLAGL